MNCRTAACAKASVAHRATLETGPVSPMLLDGFRLLAVALDVQLLAGHSALSTTQRHIEADAMAQRKVVELV